MEIDTLIEYSSISVSSQCSFYSIFEEKKNTMKEANTPALQYTTKNYNLHSVFLSFIVFFLCNRRNSL